jgi:CubicO group peptidase (beta-lactamase class C family)
VLTDVGEPANLGSIVSYGWSGAFGAYFWIDPKEDMIGVLMIQIRPYDHLNTRQDLQTVATQVRVAHALGVDLKHPASPPILSGNWIN